jgi:hypothetical protein
VRGHFIPLVMLVAGITLFSAAYRYPSMLSRLPQGSHKWRQADCLAMTENYRQFQLSFFKPATYNLQSENGQVAGEFPLFYFIAAHFKNPVFALRLFHSIVFIAGIFSVYFIAFHFFRRRFLSLLVAFLFFTSPLLVFYGNNFLSDVPALAFAFIGWSLYLYGYGRNRIKVLAAFACFTFAALLKASEALHIILCIIYSECNEDAKITGRNLPAYGCAFISLAIIASWYYYARQYNLTHHDTYYFLGISPVWKLPFPDIVLALRRMIVTWSNNYFWRPMLAIGMLALYPLIRNKKKLSPQLRSLTLWSGVLVALYILVFAEKMIRHEYYYTVFFIFLLFYIISVLKVYNAFHAENVFAHTALFLLLFANAWFCKSFVAEKLTYTNYNPALASEELQRFMVQKGIGGHAKILSIPDISPNETLCLLKRKGFTNYNNIDSILQTGTAEYLVTPDEAWMNDVKRKPHLEARLGSLHGIYLFKLK